MPDTPASESAEKDSAASEHLPTRQWAAASQWPLFATLVIALIALVLAALAYFRPTHTAAVGAMQQGGDAKANVCKAYAATHGAVVLNTHLQNPNPQDPAAELSVATSARLALVGGGAYLKDSLDANTAAPSDVANAINSVANTIEQLGINYLNRSAGEAQESLRRDLDSQLSAADKLCA